MQLRKKFHHDFVDLICRHIPLKAEEPPSLQFFAPMRWHRSPVFVRENPVVSGISHLGGRYRAIGGTPRVFSAIAALCDGLYFGAAPNDGSVPRTFSP